MQGRDCRWEIAARYSARSNGIANARTGGLGPLAGGVDFRFLKKMCGNDFLNRRKREVFSVDLGLLGSDNPNVVA